MKGEIGLIDSFRLCNIYMNIYPDGGNVKPQPERNFSIEKDLITMYQELKEVGLRGKNFNIHFMKTELKTDHLNHQYVYIEPDGS
jgi:hypothetical protein